MIILLAVNSTWQDGLLSEHKKQKENQTVNLDFRDQAFDKMLDDLPYPGFFHSS
jgi:hypothetical protein